MSIEDFIFLEDWQQIKLVAEGIYIVERPERTFHIELYRVEGFYVEKWLDLEKTEQIGFYPFVVSRRFNLYWENVSLRDIEHLL